MNLRNLAYINASISVIVLLGFIILGNAYRDAKEDLGKFRRDREEVARIEQWIEKQAPNIPSATRRGYAEFTVETKWPVETKK
jgi:hypothetical protein